MTRLSSVTRTALITGANGGLGRAIARRLAADGFHLILSDVVSIDVDATNEIAGGGVVRAITAELSSTTSVAALAKEATRHGPVDVLVNNAALQTPVPFDAIDDETLGRYLRINVEAPLQLARLLAPGMTERGRGRIINLVSGSAWMPPAGFLPYITSKMAAIGLTRTLAVELADRGITVNALTPSLTRHAGNRDALPEEFWNEISSRQAIKKVAEPDDIVGAVAFLASDDAAFMTGQTIAVDGGLVFL